MQLLDCFVRPFVWLYRIRHRRGYGVHSPFAFYLITQVIYQRAPYYKYEALRKEEKRQKKMKNSDWMYESLRLKRLLFRLVNFVKADTVLDVGRTAASSLYLKAGRELADYRTATQLDELFLDADVPIDFLYLHDYTRPDFMEKVFDVCVNRTTSRSLFVVEGIARTSAMKRIWKQMQQSERVGVTFDLYEVGILCFDCSLEKQHYIVNF
ncbi:MAG: hypothetical protein E7099_04175 [Mediterranea massiliensis]|nr:hypothetical protein [Mediterranea massiliensis]